MVSKSPHLRCFLVPTSKYYRFYETSFLSKNSPKIRVFTEERSETFYETKVNHEKNYETDAGFTKKVKFHNKS